MKLASPIPISLSAALISLTAFSAFVLSSISVSADAIVDTITVSVPESCTLSSASGSGETYNVSVSNGQYKNDIGKTRLSVFCNTQDSFAIYAVGYSNDAFGNTEMISSSASVPNIITGTATGGDTSNWAMKLEAVAGTGTSGSYTPTIISPFNDFAAVPNTWAKVAEVASVTGLTNEAAVDASYAIYIAPRQLAANYQGKVRYTVVHPSGEKPLEPVPCDAGKICYNPNAEGVVDTMGDQDSKMIDEYAFGTDCNNAGGYVDSPNLVCRSMSDDTEITIPLTYMDNIQLWASNFKRQGYGFAGWQDENGTRFGSNQVFDLSSMNIENKGLGLYAVWIKSKGDLQNWDGCSRMAIGDVTALTDARDGNTYSVAKLKDGKCWMIENLRLGGSSPITLTAADSDVVSDFVLPASTDPTTTAWCDYSHDYSCLDESLMTASNSLDSVSLMTGADANVYSYGNYYNWYTATAGSRSYTENSGDAPASICPVGWGLPSGASGRRNNYSDFYYLVTAISDLTSNDFAASAPFWGDKETNTLNAVKNLQSYSNNFITSGSVRYSEFNDRGATGRYWSKRAHSITSANGLVFHRRNGGFYIAPAHDIGKSGPNKSDGLAVRCVSK